MEDEENLITPGLITVLFATILGITFLLIYVYRLITELKLREWRGEPLGYINFLLVSPDKTFELEGPTFKLHFDEVELRNFLVDKIIETDQLPQKEKVEVLKALLKNMDEDKPLPIQVYGVGRGKEKCVLINYAPYDLLSVAKVNPEAKVEYPFQLKQIYVLAYTSLEEKVNLTIEEEAGVQPIYKLLFNAVKGLKKEESTVSAFFIHPINLDSMQVYDMPDELKEKIKFYVETLNKFVDYHDILHKLELTKAELEAERRIRKEAEERFTEKIITLEQSIQVAKEATKTGGLMSTTEIMLRLALFILLPSFLFWFIAVIAQSFTTRPIRPDAFMALGMILGIVLASRKIK